MPQADIVVHARPTTLHLVQARLFVFSRTFAGLQWIVGGFIGPPLLWVLWRHVAGRPWPPGNDFIFVAGPGLALLMLALAALGGLRQPQVKALLRDGARYAFGSAEVAIRGPMGSSVLRWEAFTRAQEFGGLFVLHGAGGLFLLPAADFGPGDAEAFRALVRRKLGGNAGVRAPR